MTAHATCAAMAANITAVRRYRAVVDAGLVTGDLVYFPPMFVQGYADVGFKDKGPAALRYTMPMLVDAPVLMTEPVDGPLLYQAHLASSCVDVRADPVFSPVNVAHLYAQAEDARTAMWSRIEAMVHHETRYIMNLLRSEWSLLRSEKAGPLDELSLELMASKIALGSETSLGLVPLALDAVVSTDRLNVVDPLRFVHRWITGRTQHHVRRTVGDVRDGSSIRSAYFLNGVVGQSPAQRKAMDLDMSGWVSGADLGGDETHRSRLGASAEDIVLARALT